MPTRRDFIAQLGVILASLLATRCLPVGRSGDTPRDRLRNCWLRLDTLGKKTQKDYERGEKTQEQLVADHKAVLNELVAVGELERAVAEHVQAAFDAAAYHIWRVNAPITCYEPVLVDFKQASSSQLAYQSAILTEMAEENDLDFTVVEQARAAIEHDMAFLSLPADQVSALYKEIQENVDEKGVPQFEKVDLEVTPEAAEAARYLVDLLLGE